MIPALWVAKTGLDAQHTHVGVISNNLANVNTIGYKRSRPVFEDLLYQNVIQPGSQTSEDTESPTGLMLGTGVRIIANQKNFSQGSLVQTENSMDMAINGSGFFQISMPDGTLAYTRDGQFQVDSQGRMVTANGQLLEPAITIPDDTLSVTIGSDGTVSVLQSGSSTVSTIGQLQIADFVNPAGLEPLGQNLYRESPASGTATVSTPGSNGTGTLLSGSLESSNVNVVEELVNLIETQRAYEMCSKCIASVDGMLQFASQQL